MNFATIEQRHAFHKPENKLDLVEVEALFPGADSFLALTLGFWPSRTYALDDDGTLLVWFYNTRHRFHLFLYYDDKLKSWV
jgi:hypothetical protein